eukprot:scaffold347_cov380-Prasinococcus_capsulatus_cf.AAC.3
MGTIQVGNSYPQGDAMGSEDLSSEGKQGLGATLVTVQCQSFIGGPCRLLRLKGMPTTKSGLDPAPGIPPRGCCCSYCPYGSCCSVPHTPPRPVRSCTRHPIPGPAGPAPAAAQYASRHCAACTAGPRRPPSSSRIHSGRPAEPHHAQHPPSPHRRPGIASRLPALPPRGSPQCGRTSHKNRHDSPGGPALPRRHSHPPHHAVAAPAGTSGHCPLKAPMLIASAPSRWRVPRAGGPRRARTESPRTRQTDRAYLEAGLDRT